MPAGAVTAAAFARFDESQNPSHLFVALESVEAAVREVAIDQTSGRRDALRLWLGFWSEVERRLDPAWTADDLPVRGAALPRDHGVVYPSGEVDPATIADPAERAAYVQALADSRAAEQHYLVQLQLRRIEARAVAAVAEVAQAWGEPP